MSTTQQNLFTANLDAKVIPTTRDVKEGLRRIAILARGS